MRSILRKGSTTSVAPMIRDLPAQTEDGSEDDHPLRQHDGQLVPMVSMLRRGGVAAPGRRPPTGRRLRNVSGEGNVPAESRIVFRFGSGLSLR